MKAKKLIVSALSAAISISFITGFSVSAEEEVNIAAGKTASWNNETVAEFTNGIIFDSGKSYSGKSSRAITIDLDGKYSVTGVRIHTGYYNEDSEDNLVSQRVASGYTLKYSKNGGQTYIDLPAEETSGVQYSSDGGRTSQYVLCTPDTVVNATHVQVIVPATESDQVKRIREVEIFGGDPVEEVPEPENIALNKTASWNNETVAEFTNGIFAESGKSYNGKSGRAITVDLGGAYTVSEVKVHTGYYNEDSEDNSVSNRVASGYTVKYSTDGETYYDAAAAETMEKDDLSQYSLNTLDEPVVATHIQIIAPATDTAQIKRIREVEIWGVEYTGEIIQPEKPTSTPESGNIALNKTATWTRNDNAEPVAAFTDGDLAGSISYSGKVGHTITINLDGVYSVSSVRIHTGYNNEDTGTQRVSEDYNIKYSMDGVSYTAVNALETTGKEGTSNYTLYEFGTEVNARYIQVKCPDFYESTIVRLREIEVFGTAANYDEFQCDEKIKLYVNGSENETLAAGTVKAAINMHVPEADDAKYGMLTIAVYKNGVLQTVKMDAKSVSGDGTFEVSAAVAETDGVTVKAMFWDKDMKEYVYASQLK